ncbi:peptidoglycan-binding domain-containing protein [Fictibacillus sp. JL2B1089]|uniref:peptidoglycan-binding domain-containing protein n=1 Tax=Fictibacillus sp. JL2B1089 TaxID=3399565 RepID=UPI003A850E73
MENSISNQTIPTPAPKPSPQPTPGTNNSILKNGDTGQRVRDLQNKLKRAGYSLAADGVYGPNTENAVRSFQRKYNLTVDGIAGPNTLNKLNAVLTQPTKPTQPAPPKSSNSNGSAVVPYPGYVIKRGSTDSANISRIQRALNISADGNFGPQTESAVKAYQKRKGLAVDGIVGQATWNTLF